TKRGPRGHRANVYAFGLQRVSGIPDFLEPPELLFARAREMRFGDREWPPVAAPNFLDERLRIEHARRIRAHCFNVRVSLLPIAAVTRDRILGEPMVQESLARHVMIQAE